MLFNNDAALKAALVAACTNAVAGVEEKVFEEFAGNLNQYYTEFHPKEYIRTGALYNSLDRTGVQPTGSGASAEVYFNTPSYVTGAVPMQSGRTGWATWSGETVLDVAMSGSHGGYVGGTAIWDESISGLGDIESLLLRALRAQGIPVK
jgi:hypothetical protein